MDKESLIKAREFLMNIDKLDMPIQDKVEIIRNVYFYLDPEHYEENTKTLAKKFNEELRWRGKK